MNPLLAVAIPVAAGLGVMVATWPAGRAPRYPMWPAADGGRGSPRKASRSVGPTRLRGEHSREPVAGCCELLAVAIASGCTPAEAVEEVGGAPGAGDEISGAAIELRRGRPLTEVLDAMATRSGGWHSLAMLLAMSASSGADATEPLRRLAATERLKARRRREARARRLPVLLLLPLTGLVLPAFVLVTVVPFVLSGADVFRLPPVGEPGSPLVDPGES